MAAILILEDDYALACRWRSAMDAVGHRVVLAFTVEEALATLEHEPFDLLIADLIIKIEGLESAKGGSSLLFNLRHHADKRIRALPVIGVSGFKPFGSPDLAKQSFKTFAVEHFLVKPFETAELLATVEEALRDAQSAE